MNLRNKSVVLGVTGGIAAYKAAALCSHLVKAGAVVDTVLTEAGAITLFHRHHANGQVRLDLVQAPRIELDACEL